MYKNLRRLQVAVIIWTVIQLMLVLPMVVCIMITFDNSVYEKMADPLPYRITYAIIGFGSLTPTVIFWIKLALMMFVNRINNIFEKDSDGTVPLSEVAKAMKMSEARIIKKTERAIRKGYLINCNYSMQQRCFLLSDKSGIRDTVFKDVVDNHPFIGVNCPSCTAALKIRANTQGTCPFCGCLIMAPSITPENK